MGKKTLFDSIVEQDVKKLLNTFQCRKVSYKKERTIVSNLTNTNMICIVLEGQVDLIRYDYNGNRTILEELSTDDVFGEVFSADNSNDIAVIAKTNCEIMFLDYPSIIKGWKKNNASHEQFIENMLNMITRKIIEKNERIEVLTKRSIREKLLSYLENIKRKKISNTFTLPLSYTDLADYLSIDRSAMMREIKKLKEEGFIDTKGKKVTMFY